MPTSVAATRAAYGLANVVHRVERLARRDAVGKPVGDVAERTVEALDALRGELAQHHATDAAVVVGVLGEHEVRPEIPQRAVGDARQVQRRAGRPRRTADR